MEIEAQIKDQIVETGGKALKLVDEYFNGEVKKDGKIKDAFTMLGFTTKILHMNQHRMLTERSQALRLLNFLPDQKTKNEYIKITNPQAKALLLDRPK